MERTWWWRLDYWGHRLHEKHLIPTRLMWWLCENAEWYITGGEMGKRIFSKVWS